MNAWNDILQPLAARVRRAGSALVATWTLLSLLLATLLPGIALADYVGEAQTTIFLDKSTRDMIAARYQAGQPGLQVGDDLSYIIQFTPYPGGTTELVGGGAYVTEYVPAGTQVVGAEFVQYNGGSGTYTTIAPPPPAEVSSVFVPQYSETGIFYSTDPRTAMYTNNGSPTITVANGFAGPGGGPATGYSIHNAWDAAIYPPYVANLARVAGCGASAATVPSPVAGPDTLITGNAATGQGPWHRISYPGSTFGTTVGVAGTHGGCIGGTPTSAGWPLSTSNPLPANVNAIRFAGGQTTVGQLFSVRVTLRLTQPVPATGLINNSEVFGGDVSILTNSTLGSKSNIWRYLFPSVANADTSLTLVKTIVGMCTGAACTPQPYTGGSVPSVANLKLRYEITYLNSSGGPQANVQLSDAMPTGGALVAGSANIISGPNILPTTTVAGGFNFQPLATLGSGGGGTVQVDVLFATAPANNVTLVNTAKMTTASLPGGVTSTATTTPVTLASLNIDKSTSTPTVAPGGVASYSITIPNTGAGTASALTVTDTLPSAGTTTAVADRFSYQVGSVTASLTSSTGVVTAVSPVTATVTAPTAAPFKEKVSFTFPAGTTIPSGSTLTVNFNAAVGANMPESPTPYLNDTDVTYTGGTTAGTTSSIATGVAPVTVTVPLALVKSIDCVYSGATCNPYSPGDPVPTASKIRYRLDYANTSAAAQANVVLTDTLPTNTTFVTGTATELGTPYGIVPPSVGGQVLTFGTIASLSAGANGAVTFDVQLGSAAQIPSGSYITNTAKLTSTAFPGGVQANLTSTVLDQANLVVTKTTSTPTIAVGGTVTYNIHVVNTGSTNATTIKIYDWLPYTGTVNNAALRFNYGASTYTLPAAPSTLTAPTVTTARPPNVSPYNTHTNQQQVLWTFTAAQALAPGASFDISFTATAGASIPAGSTIYYNNVQAVYNSGATVLYGGQTNVAPVTIPTGLVISKSIDCVYNAAGTVCDAYTGSGLVPVNAKVRYRIHYQNTSAAAQTNVYICDQLTSTQASPAFTATITTPVTLPPTPSGPYTNTAAPDGPPAGAVSNPANAACGFAATGVRFSYPVIPSLAAGASGDVYFDMATNAASGATLANTGKIVSTQAPSGETSSVSAVALSSPQLNISKTTSTPTAHTGDTVTYTITVSNTGSASTTSLQVYDFLPYEGTTTDATKRFAYAATSGYTKNGGAFAPAPTLTTVAPPTVAPYNANTNQQQVLWDFGSVAGNQLAPGDSITITFTATVGSAMPPAVYGNSVQADFGSASGPGSINANNQAAVTVPAGVNITGQVYVDADHNGSLDTGESWNGGTTVYMKLFSYNGSNCVSPALGVQTVTAPLGAYSFTGVAAGQYCVVLSDNSTATITLPGVPAGWSNTLPNPGELIVSVGAVDVPNQNFGLYSGAVLTGRVFEDTGAGGGTANNAVQDGAEAGIANVTVTLNNASCPGGVCGMALTDGGGNFTLAIPPLAGSYTLVETNAANYTSTGGSAGTSGGSYAIATDTTTFSYVAGTPYSGMNFADVPANQLLTDGTQTTTPGSILWYSHSYIAGTAGSVVFSSSATTTPAAPAWSEVLYVDSNCNAVYDVGELALSNPQALVAGQTICLLLKEFVPAAAPLGAQNAVTLTASFTQAITEFVDVLTRNDVTTVGQYAAAGLTLVKSVDKASALPGDTLVYTISYVNNSSGALSDVIINDVTPSYTTFVSASCGALPANLTLCSTTVPAVGGTGSISYTFTGTLAPSAGSSVTFSVQVQP